MSLNRQFMNYFMFYVCWLSKARDFIRGECGALRGNVWDKWDYWDNYDTTKTRQRQGRDKARAKTIGSHFYIIAVSFKRRNKK
jgi:hypothetical protein